MWSAAILAGGRARRLGGQDKSALIVDGVRLLDRQLAALHSLTDTILLVGYPGLAPASCVVVPDHRPGTGPLGAISTALSAATTERVLIVAVDLPFLTTAFLEFLARADEDADAVVPVSGGRWQPLCAMYRRRAAPVLDAAIDRGELAVHAAVARLNPTLIAGDSLAPFDPEHRLFVNINTPDDLGHWGSGSGRNRTAAPETSQTTSR
jgi:molybdopterin-guanine dinucleotide biosynthesis protein A